MHIELIKKIAAKVYSQDMAEDICRQLPGLIARYAYPDQPNAYSERDAILITYGDMLTREDENPLTTLHAFLKLHAQSAVNTIHILPFFPFSSDEGFSVIDYKTVNPRLGSWEDIHALAQDFDLMFDLVANHTSVESEWFKGFLECDDTYRDYYINVPPDSDTRSVFRPRTSQLLTPFQTQDGIKHVWTTFSADQADLNYQDPQVLLEMIDILLFYVSRSARYIRLDAIAYIWKELDTSCIHLPQVHHIIQIMRLVLDAVSPGVRLITETNVPHKDNISYFGSGEDEAQLVYNFSLPPLTLHAFHTGNAEIFTHWAATLAAPSESTAFFNFLASHDGIGITPAHGILPPEEITAMAKRVEASGGYVSYKTNADGSQSAYEFNINYFDALNDPHEKDIPLAWKVRRFVTAHAIMAALQGVPGIYFHSLFGSTSWFKGVKESGMARTINRKRLQAHALEKELADKNSLRSQIFSGLAKLFSVRRQHPAFHPNTRQSVPMLHPSVISIVRSDPEIGKQAICLHNVSAQDVNVDLKRLLKASETDASVHVIYHNNHGQNVMDNFTLKLAPFASIWLSSTAN